MCVPSPASVRVFIVGADPDENAPLASPLIMSLCVGAELVENRLTWSPVNISMSDISVLKISLRSAVIFEVPFQLLRRLQPDAQLPHLDRRDGTVGGIFKIIHMGIGR